jgi:hypothetical protein
MKALVSREAFLRRVFTRLSRKGSMQRFRKVNMSFIVSNATFERDERSDSASLISCPTMVLNYPTPCCKSRLEWCLQRRLIVLHPSNCAIQWLALVSSPWFSCIRAFFNSFSEFSRGSRSSVAIYFGASSPRPPVLYAWSIGPKVSFSLTLPLKS